MKLGKACEYARAAKAPPTTRTTTDAPINATPEELASIRDGLAKIEPLLSALFGKVYAPGETSQKPRIEAADLIEHHFDGVVEAWAAQVETIFGGGEGTHEALVENLSNALIRFVSNLRDRHDLTTYIYLRKHCQEGMLSRALPSQFNVVHIALKEVVLPHVREALRGARMELVRDSVVAAVDERRLMVGQ